MESARERLSKLDRCEARALILVLRHPLNNDAELAELAGVSVKTFQAQLRTLRLALGWPPGIVKRRILASGITEADVLEAYRMPTAHAGRDKLAYVLGADQHGIAPALSK